MLVKPDEQTLQALARFAESAEFPVIRKWLESSWSRCVAASTNPDEAIARQNQGAFVLIGELVENTQKAQELSRR